MHNCAVALPLTNDEILDVMRVGAAVVADRPETLVDLEADQVQLAIDQAASVTAGRIEAWRRRAREMTWLELRVFFVGLRETK